MEDKTNTFQHCEKPEIVVHETDILLIGGGMSACGAAYEADKWATEQGLRITMVDKAATDRSGAVAMGLSAINTYLGENSVDDYVRYVRQDLMGIIREDLVFDLGRVVDDSVHLFEDWGLPVWKKDDDGKSLDGHQAEREGKESLRDGGTPVRSGRWQIMINGESYKVVVAEAAKLALENNRKATGVDQNLFERVFIVKLMMDQNDPKRVAGAVGFSVRENKLYIFKCKTALLGTGGCVNVFRTRATAEGQGRAWFPVWNAGSNYAMAAEAGAELTLMENRFVPARFKDGYGPVGAWFLLFKAKATNALGEDYCQTHLEESRKLYGKYVDAIGTCLRNHMMMIDMKAGKGPIKIHTDVALKNLADTMSPKEIKHLESEAWEDFLDMTIAQAGVWAANNMAPEEVPSELMPSEPYLLGSHAGCAGIWVSGPGDFGPSEYAWGYNRMTTVNGLFTAGDGVGASGHKFSSGSHAEGRIAAKAMTSFIMDHKDDNPTFKETADELAAEIYLPMETYAKYQSYSTDPDINPNYIKPAMLQQRLQKIMDEYVGGVSTWYTTSKTMLEEGLNYLEMLKEDSFHMGAKDLHELLRAWENFHRILAGEAHAQHILFREETRYPGYYYRGDHLAIDDDNWRCFVNSTYDKQTKKWNVFKKEYHQLIPDK
ncbi:MAG: adenylyl-sulfate reductase subunit alpha [Deltaproteobacteria bacterium]|nr:adenylyl-sulfate reductase subunit alpha [Deltaproteobacteria bacterium]